MRLTIHIRKMKNPEIKIPRIFSQMLTVESAIEELVKLTLLFYRLCLRK